MNIKIKLENSKYCDGCLFLSYIPRNRDLEGVAFCKYKHQFITLKIFKEKVIRPKECIKENGE